MADTTDFQAKLYLYDLDNCAKEHWFKPTEDWELTLTTNEERLAIEKKYYPTVALKGLPQTLVTLMRQVNEKLAQRKPNELRPEAFAGATGNFEYITAFNPKRIRS